MAVMTSPPASVRDTLKSVFGFDRFREGQEAAITRLLDGKSVLAVFPTGAGKSLCYQLPALMLDGITLVVSPLIALMKDQIDFLTSRGVAAARLDSTVEFEEGREIYRRLHRGELKLLYVAPERLANERFQQTLRQMRISMLAVDEAHCISEWGHNFRPDYLKLAALARTLKVGRVLALTATATPSVAADIVRAFDIAADDHVQTGFYRPNLTLRVTPCAGSQRTKLLIERLRQRPAGSSIVYVTLQKTAEEIADVLTREGFAAACYHAGLSNEIRHEVQDRFMGSANAIVVATIAFGMGIDKRDIRYVYHYNLPKSLENYSQEIGRAGRDGKSSICELLAARDDVTTLENFSYGDTPTPQAVDALVRDVLGRGQTFDLSIYELSQTHDIRPLVLETTLTYLELLGLIEGTGPFYNEYKFQPLTNSTAMLAKFDAPRAAFLKKVFARASKAETWWRLRLDDAVQASGEPRQRIVAALNYLEEQGDLKLQVSGAMQGYRLKEGVGPIQEGRLRPIIEKLNARFVDREQRDVARLAEVLKFADCTGCRTRYLLTYFGEPRDIDCKHCDRCEGVKRQPLPVAAAAAFDGCDTELVARLRDENQAALAHPRQLARFLCGLPSPRLTRHKLSRHASFGVWSQRPFKAVLEMAEKANGKG